MKSLTNLVLVWVLVSVSACSSGSTTSRTDYVDPAFNNVNSKRAVRAVEIRKLYPNLSEQQVAEKVANEIPLTVDNPKR